MNSVCIDGMNLALSKGSGIATYGRNLLTNLRTIGLGRQVLFGPAAPLGSSSVVNEAAFLDADQTSRKLHKAERLRRTVMSRFDRKVVPVVPSGEVIWPDGASAKPDADYFWSRQDLFYYANRSYNRYGTMTPVRFAPSQDASAPTVMHWTAVMPLHARDVPNIYTLHDLIPLKLPHSTVGDKASYLALCKKILERADHIAVVSETTKQDVVRLLGVDEDRVTNTYQAVSIPEVLRARTHEEVALELEGVFNLGWKEYFLYFGAIEPKKNLGRIIEAYLASGVQEPLIIVGGRAWLADRDMALLNQIQRDGGPASLRIRQYEYLPFPMLISLIRGATGVLFPSLYEGFGLPVLEAMSLETCVLTSTAGSLPEVVGDAAVSVDPYDVQAMTRGIQALSADDGLRAELVEKGLIRAAMFTPEAYQHRLRGMYEKLGVL